MVSVLVPFPRYADLDGASIARAGYHLLLLLDRRDDRVLSLVDGVETVVRAVIEWNGERAFLSGFTVRADQRRRGLGGLLMGVLVDAADRRGIFLHLRVKAFGGDGAENHVVERVIARHGFVRMEGEDRDGLPWGRCPRVETDRPA